ncbi:XRE family transcriptional regulator [Streptomyces rubiginosohelvolus]|uniref:XRE family transcriptional regulator n=1 Tax=Streptomyces rubiginosohelvolus TaxID=67362 RepID=UPI0034016541|nr:XRE family transcriptional regulator [Streptomyces rubiginosohelvolus]
MSAADIRKQRELAEARARLIAYLQRVAGPALTAEDAQAALEKAKAWNSGPARALDNYFVENPNALTEPSPHSPLRVVRLLQHLEAAGHGDAVTQLACARCHRTGLRLTRNTPEGRCCDWCVARTELRPCARCGRDGHIVTRREEGPICRHCYYTDPQVVEECAECGRIRKPSRRREDGTSLCQGCAPKPEHTCVRCGKPRPAQAVTADGPVCRGCYRSPSKLCDLCQQVKPISVRKTEGQPAICVDCYRGPKRTCVHCNRFRHGFQHHSGEFYCASCRPRRSLPCADCGETKPVQVNWPVGTLCDTCYQRRKRNPAPCAQCGTLRTLVGRTEDGNVCGPCSGTDIDFSCRRCGYPGDIYADGSCSRCVSKDRVRDLLGDEDGNVHPQLQPLAEQLGAAQEPWSVITWTRRSESARMLAGLAARHQEITHEILDELPQDWGTLYVRELLVAANVLPKRQENFARLRLWLDTTLADVPPHHAHVIRPFAEWGVLRDARRRADKGRYTAGAASNDRTDIRTAIKFMTWLDENSITLAGLSQEVLDLWLTKNPTRARGLSAFIRWAVARRMTSKVTVPTRRHGLPSRFMHSDELNQQLRRCLNDDSLPLEARIIGCLISLYALPTTRIVELTTDRFHRDGDDAYLTLNRHPVLLPPRLSVLIEKQIVSPNCRTSVLQQPHDGTPGFLFPGRPPSRPRSAETINNYMRKHGLPGISARNTAMMEAITDLPPIVVSDLFGMHPKTAYVWSQYAQNSWAEYLEAAQATD